MLIFALLLAATNPNIPSCVHDVQITNAADPGIAKADFKPNVEAGAIVKIDASGNVVDSRLVLSSGSTAIDDDVLNAARKSTYEPGMDVDWANYKPGMPVPTVCQPKGGWYFYHIATGPH